MKQKITRKRLVRNFMKKQKESRRKRRARSPRRLQKSSASAKDKNKVGKRSIRDSFLLCKDGLCKV